MKWLLITAYFPPEIGSASFLFYEFGQKLVKHGHEVTVITGFPKYNVDKKDLPAQYRRRLLLKEEVSGMHVVRVKTVELPRYVPVARGVEQFLTAFIFIMTALLCCRKKYDRIAVYSPPLPLGLTAYIVGRLRKIPYIFNVQDLFPQSAIDLGILKNRLLIRMFEKLEAFIYRNAFLVTAHSEGNRQHVISMGGKQDRVRVIPNWVDTDSIKSGERMNSFRTEYGLGDKFVISFAGVIGYSQDLDTVIESIQYLKEYKDILFVLVGDGVEKKRLEEKVKALGYDNVRFVPMLPKAKYPFVLHASDLCLVTLHKEVKTPVVPSKLLSIMASTRPVVASLNIDGDAPKIINDARCGICVEPGNPQKLAEAIIKIYKDPALADEYGKNGRKYAEVNFSLDHCVKMYEVDFEVKN